MPTAALLPPRHLNRKALLSLRQSSPPQGLSNQDSLRMPYALQQRAQELGWPATAIEIIAGDLGTPAARADHRQGVKDALAHGTLGPVGRLVSCEVTRLSRTCADWYPLLEVCGDRDCRIADRAGVDDPGPPKGRVLLGVPGPRSALARHTIRARLTAAILTKAQRGERALPFPVGFVRAPLAWSSKPPPWRATVACCGALTRCSTTAPRAPGCRPARRHT